ncbi:hypothetical protein [Nesterenkonia natronophila]|uniref:Uncharacterized protein n=1 Tax=Nesterenkonia natronophila TaxID=2174932 RepID=A0A3A4F254_9MICC|nr:hypothetical protein [Nesterenkonia natronophila]RJN31791.1 hypothetical protein D3250_06610 [Nesterenkonia natronophila]
MSPLSYLMLVIVTMFNAITAIAGGVALLATGGLGMPRSMLVNGPFDSFLWPGIILLMVVGGTQVIAAILLLLRREAALLWTAVAGFAMIIWIFVETGIIAAISWLQVVYFTTGICQLSLVLILLGVTSRLSRETQVSIGPPTSPVGRQ